MKQKKQWYDYLWIFSLTYLILGFFNILFAWLGLLCFFIPLAISVAKGNKAYCNKYCGRGQLFSLVGGRFGLSRKKDIPGWMKSSYFRYGFLVFFFAMFFLMLWNTYLVFAGAKNLGTVVTLLWTFKLPWHWAYHGTVFSDGVAQFAFGFYSVMLTSTVRILSYGNNDAAYMQSKTQCFLKQIFSYIQREHRSTTDSSVILRYSLSFIFLIFKPFSFLQTNTNSQ